MAHLAFRAEWVETPRLPAFAAPCWAGGAASGGGETAVGAVGCWCSASCPLASGSCWLGPLSCCRKQNALSSLIAHLEAASHPFLHGGSVPASPFEVLSMQSHLGVAQSKLSHGWRRFQGEEAICFLSCYFKWKLLHKATSAELCTPRW